MNIFTGAIQLITKLGWRKSVYLTRGEKKEFSVHLYDMPCSQCGTKIRIAGITIEEALNRAFNTIAPPFPISTGKSLGELDLKEEYTKAQKHYAPLFEAKMLLATLDYSIQVDDTNEEEGFLYSCYVNLNEWNDRQNSQDDILKLLNQAKEKK
jgi:hypothetical protein